MLRHICRLFCAATVLATGLAAASHAQDWGNMATVSATMGVNDGRVCVGEATRGDIGCPAYAPYVATDGTISATRFVGDGSGLTNLNLSGSVNDRITSGTAGVFVSDTGVINLRTGGVTTGYLDTAGRLVAPGISITTANGISSTNGYFSGKVGLGTTTPSNTLHVAGTLGIYPADGQSSSPGGGLVIRMNHPATGGYSQMEIAGNRWPVGTGLIFTNYIFAIQATANLQALSGFHANLGYFGPSPGGTQPSVLLGAGGDRANIVAMKYASSPYPELTLSGPTIHFYTKANAMWPDGNIAAAPYGTSRLMIAENGNVGIGSSFTSTTTRPSATLHVSGTTRLTSWTMVNANATPTTPLEVSGTVSATYVKLADNNDLPCAPERYGTLRFSNGRLAICKGQ